MGTVFWFFMCVLAVQIGLLHLFLFLERFPRNQQFWKATDYFWLAIAAVGLLGVTRSAREDHYRDSQKFMITSRNHHLNSAQIEMERELKLSRIERELAKTAVATAPSERGNERIHQAEVAVAWCESVSGALSRVNPTLGWRQHLEGVADILPTDGDELKGKKQRLRDRLEQLYDCDDRVRFYDSELRLTPGEARWFGLAPWLLTVAIAIRVTKVTAEVRSYDKPLAPGSEVSKESEQPPNAHPPHTNGTGLT